MFWSKKQEQTAVMDQRQVFNKHIQPKKAVTFKDKKERDEALSLLLPVEPQSEIYDAYLSARYQKLDLSFLSMLHKDRTPRFAVYTPERPDCFLRYSGGLTSSIHDSILQYYNTVHFHWLWLKEPGSLMLTAQFRGLIPPQIRQLIRESGPDFNQIYICREETWKVTRIPDPDPIVFGWSSYAKAAYLIAVFDTTTAEEMVAREFTSDKVE